MSAPETTPAQTPPAKLDANQLARQRKKIEKDRRRKHYDDLQVQGTNNSSIVSKRSVEMLYTKEIHPEMGEWFKFFVPKPKRRSPAINRGYWIRMESIRQMVLRIIDQNPDRAVNVVNLGCGFDPLPFQLLGAFRAGGDAKQHRVSFLDFDYPELVQNKKRMIQEAAEISDLVGAAATVSASDAAVGIVLSGPHYKLVGCDLKDQQLYQRQLAHLLRPDTVNIFVAEVSLAYMKPQHANPVIELSSQAPRSHFVILEQILPDTPHCAFAQKMMYHFNHLRSPLQCVESYPHPEDQIRRFHQYYPDVELKNLLGNWMYLVDEATRTRVARIETFDEWEEFIIFCQHYVIVHATNTGQMVYDTPHTPAPPALARDPSVQFALEADLQLPLKFPAVATVGSQVVVHGGLDQTRTDRTVAYAGGQVTPVATSGAAPSARMCHTITAVNGQDALLIGGRSRPGQLLADVHRLRGGHIWEPMPALTHPRARHSAVQIGNEVLVFGGLQGAGDLFVMYGETSRGMKVEGDPIVNLFSCAMAYNGEFGVIAGGMENPDHPWISSKLYRFTVHGDTVRVHLWMNHPQFARMGAQGVLTPDTFVLIGGVSTTAMVRRDNHVITMPVSATTPPSPSPSLRAADIPMALYASHPPIFVGFAVVPVPQSPQIAAAAPASGAPAHFLVLAGGAVCYSFGSCYNHVYRLTVG